LSTAITGKVVLKLDLFSGHQCPYTWEFVTKSRARSCSHKIFQYMYI